MDDTEKFQQIADQIKLDFDQTYTPAGIAGTITQAVGGNWPYSVTTGSSGGGYTWTTTGTNTGTVGITNNDWFTPQKKGLYVDGDAEFEGDVKVKGRSITEMLDKIEERLAILHPNEKLEDKWEELKKLGDAYRALEKDIIEKEKMWNTLKK